MKSHCSTRPRAFPFFSLSPPVNHAKFKPRDSATFTPSGQSYTVSYGSGSATIALGYDTLRVSAPRALPALPWLCPAWVAPWSEPRRSPRADLTSCAAKAWTNPGQNR